MINIRKSKNTQTVHIGTVSSSSADDYAYIRTGNLFDVVRINTDIPDIKRTHFSKISGVSSDGSEIIFNNAIDLENYFNQIFKTTKNYCPNPVINSVSATVVGLNSTTDLVIKGLFLDQVQEVISTSILSVGTLLVNSVTVVDYTQIIINVTADNNIDNFILTLEGACGNIDLPQLQVLNIDVIIPSVTGTGTSLWNKLGTSNGTTVTTGGFECENTNGNGWNEHAYFGGVTSSTRVDFSMTIDRLNSTTNAYCYVRFNNTNTPSTAGNPRIYIQNGNSLLAYSSSGTQSTLPSPSVGDVIKVSFTPTTMEVYQNGVSVFSHTGTYNLTNLFTTFTGYRVFKASNIQLQVFN